MPRVQFDDITPPNRRSIRDIPIPNGGKRKVPIIKPEPPKEPVLNDEPAFPNKPAFNSPSNFESKMSDVTKKDSGAYEYYYPKDNKESVSHISDSAPVEQVRGKGKKKQWVFGTIIIILIAGFIVGMMTVFASATINITPKTQEIAVDAKITGSIEKIAGNVRYEVVKLSESKTASVSATGEEAVELRASGKIVIYNNFSTEPQRLIVRTRFETPEGLIFRIPESVIVPGKTTKGGVSTPGSIEVTVSADDVGEKYNIKKTDFTIPGFKNDSDRYKNFYARSSTDMTGGFVGKRKTVVAGDKQTALQGIDSDVQAKLQKNLEEKVPEGLALLSGSIIYKSQELPQEEDDSSVVLGKEITAYAIMLNKQDLSNKIISEYTASSSDWKNIKPVIKDFSNLKMANVPNNLDTGEKIDLVITGKVNILADIDTSMINQKLLGAPKKDAAKLMDEFAGILSITATIRPVWKQSFPQDSSKIHVQTVDIK